MYSDEGSRRESFLFSETIWQHIYIEVASVCVCVYIYMHDACKEFYDHDYYTIYMSQRAITIYLFPVFDKYYVP